MIKLDKKMLKSEIMYYAVAGLIVTIVNAICYYIFLYVGLIYTVANLASIIISKIIGYLLNKFMVYKTKTEGWKETFFELCRFFIARGLTGILDFFGLIFLVEIVGINEAFSKISIMLFIVALNYVLGKRAVFIKGDNEYMEEVDVAECKEKS